MSDGATSVLVRSTQGRAFDPAQALASRLSYHTRAHHEPRASQVHHGTSTFKPKVSFSVHRPGPSVTIDDGIPPTSNFCKLKLQSVKSLPSPAAEGLGQSPSSEVRCRERRWVTGGKQTPWVFIDHHRPV